MRVKSWFVKFIFHRSEKQAEIAIYCIKTTLKYTRSCTIMGCGKCCQSLTGRAEHKEYWLTAGIPLTHVGRSGVRTGIIDLTGVLDF